MLRLARARRRAPARHPRSPSLTCRRRKSATSRARRSSRASSPGTTRRRASGRACSWCTSGGATTSTRATRRSGSRSRATSASRSTCTARARSTTHPPDAQAFVAEATKDPAVVKARFLAALDLLKKDPHVDPKRVAAIGYCFGGGIVLAMARQGVDLDAVVTLPRRARHAAACRAGGGEGAAAGADRRRRRDDRPPSRSRPSRRR